jgi:hypothetical protein
VSQNFKAVYDEIYNRVDAVLPQTVLRGAVPELAQMPRNPDQSVKPHVVVRFGTPVAEMMDRSVAREADQMNRATVSLHCIARNSDIAESVGSLATQKLVGFEGTDFGPLGLWGGGGMGDVLDANQKPQASIFTVMFSFYLNLGTFDSE